MNTLLSAQAFLRQLHSASTTAPSWLLLQPGHPRHQTLWTSESGQFSRHERAVEIARIVARIPGGGQPATQRAPWATDLVKLVLGGSREPNDSVVLPIIYGKRLVALIGWDRRGQPMADFVADAQRIREVCRHCWQTGQLEVENEALRWMLLRSDRPVACARQDGSLLGANPMGNELLMRLQYGETHHFRSGPPTLPKDLALGVDTRPAGQVRLAKHCTARFEELLPRSVCLQPVVGIEFFVEAPTQMPRPLSRLTPVEREISDLICAGLTNGEIAKRRGCAYATVKNQVSSVLQKLGVARRQQLLVSPTALPAIQLRNPGMKGSTVSMR